MSKRAIFLDRDGVLNEDLGYVGQVERFHVFPYTGQALRILADKGFLLFVVTNQSGIGRGYYTMEDTERLHSILCEKMKSFQVNITGICVAPHHPDEPSEIRKPSPKMVLDFAKEHSIDLASSYVIGDSPTDLEMGYRAGCKVVLVRSGVGAKTEKIDGVKYDYIFENLLEAAQMLK